MAGGQEVAKVGNMGEAQWQGGELYERNFNDHTPSTQACTSLCKAKQPNHAIARPSQANAPPIFDGGMMMGRTHHSIAPPIKDGGIDGGGALGGEGLDRGRWA